MLHTFSPSHDLWHSGQQPHNTFSCRLTFAPLQMRFNDTCSCRLTPQSRKLYPSQAAKLVWTFPLDYLSKSICLSVQKTTWPSCARMYHPHRKMQAIEAWEKGPDFICVSTCCYIHRHCFRTKRALTFSCICTCMHFLLVMIFVTHLGVSQKNAWHLLWQGRLFSLWLQRQFVIKVKANITDTHTYIHIYAV